jgi:hypothetical protein
MINLLVREYRRSLPIKAEVRRNRTSRTTLNPPSPQKKVRARLSNQGEAT